ncbi:hypothetical protein QBC37DRAFT_356453 [Rhypophila decipiens]|uniref:Uncharacterized protein n=1 Tax=Rhypophila decipiens TaxID=261697 RepID=A0AAN6XU91_9PEZI|nr:hypothetical protein QBC37DRAFT_356453 [Rhypophila decipiens]
MARTKPSAREAGDRPRAQRGQLGQWQPSQRPPRRFPPTTRLNFPNPNRVDVWGWPSRGGVIVLPRVCAVDFAFLGLDPIDPPLLRDRDQEREDLFCQSLLSLGAKWFDSDARRGFVAEAEDYADEDTLEDLQSAEQPWPTLMERRWVSVAYPGEGGLWIVEYDTAMYNGQWEEDNQVPEDAAQVQMARDMSQKVEILKRMKGARFYASAEEYERVGGGKACLNWWVSKTAGEVGPLEKTVYPGSG